VIDRFCFAPKLHLILRQIFRFFELLDPPNLYAKIAKLWPSLMHTDAPNLFHWI